jgi:hypothetical protein
MVAAFAMTRVLGVDPVMRMDPLLGNALTPARECAMPRSVPRSQVSPHRETARKFHADRIAPEHLTKGRPVADVFIVVAVGAPAFAGTTGRVFVASEAKQSSIRTKRTGLRRRCATRNDGHCCIVIAGLDPAIYPTDRARQLDDLLRFVIHTDQT